MRLRAAALAATAAVAGGVLMPAASPSTASAMTFRCYNLRVAIIANFQAERWGMVTILNGLYISEGCGADRE